MSSSSPSEFLIQRLKETLEGRELEVILLRLGVGENGPLTLQEIGDRLGVTRERIRQIQHRALFAFADPELNAMLLVDSLSHPTKSALYSGRRKRFRNTNAEIITKTELRATQDEEQELITVLFSSPVKGFDPISGDLFTSDRHKVFANWARVNKEITEFLNDDSLIVASWETKTISSIQWPSGKVVPPSTTSYAERMDEIRKRYPNAWSKWSYEEDQQLIREFREGMKIKDCVIKHGRARGGIVSRLRKLELISEDQSTVGL